MNNLEVLTRARALIEKGWCQRAYARDSKGLITRPESEDAVTFCMLGAVKAILREDSWDSQLDNILALLSEAVQVTVIGLPCWNDQAARTKTDILVVAYDRAIELAKAKQESTTGRPTTRSWGKVRE